MNYINYENDGANIYWNQKRELLVTLIVKDYKLEYYDPF